MRIIRKIALVTFKDRKLMMVRSKSNEKTFYNLGGKIEEGESDIDCIVREVKEEVNSRVDKNSIEFLHEFETEAHGKVDTMLNMRVYKGILLNEPVPSSEIAEIQYFDSTASVEQVSVMGKLILEWLKKNNFID